MGRGDLPDMSRAHGAQGQVQTYQANHDYTCYICYITPWKHHNTMATTLFG